MYLFKYFNHLFVTVFMARLGIISSFLKKNREFLLSCRNVIIFVKQKCNKICLSWKITILTKQNPKNIHMYKISIFLYYHPLRKIIKSADLSCIRSVVRWPPLVHMIRFYSTSLYKISMYKSQRSFGSIQ